MPRPRFMPSDPTKPQGKRQSRPFETPVEILGESNQLRRPRLVGLEWLQALILTPAGGHISIEEQEKVEGVRC